MNIDSSKADIVSELSGGFPPRTAAGVRVLVLGSLPGQRSLAAGEYYAHPRNVFWKIVEDLFGIARSEAYAARCRALNEAQVALWDVLKSSQRNGSLDAAIDVATAQANDIAGLLRAHPTIRLVAFNGRKAEALFVRFVAGQLPDDAPATVSLPSTSPAHAAMPYADKLARWSVVQTAAAGNGANAG